MISLRYTIEQTGDPRCERDAWSVYDNVDDTMIERYLSWDEAHDCIDALQAGQYVYGRDIPSTMHHASRNVTTL